MRQIGRAAVSRKPRDAVAGESFNDSCRSDLPNSMVIRIGKVKISKVIHCNTLQCLKKSCRGGAAVANIAGARYCFNPKALAISHRSENGA